MQARILIVDDNREMADTLAQAISGDGYEVTAEYEAAAALARVTAERFDVVVTDLRMEALDGLALLEALKKHDPGLPVILMTAFGSVETAIEAVKRGAFHYLQKPLKLGELRAYIGKAATQRSRLLEYERQSHLASELFSLRNLVGTSAPITALRQTITTVAGTDSPVLITGETGTGKEVVARAIHFNGPRARRPFVAINCTALPAGLLESELFGHVRGAYTGALSARDGVFAEADGGTLFLDEIGDMSVELQARLLRTLEDGLVRPVGGSHQLSVDTRIITATHRDLAALVRERKFRADLYFRINVLPIPLPPLRERREDIPALAEHFLRRNASRLQASPVRGLSPQAIRLLGQQHWPGNVRELEKTIERVSVLGSSEVVGAEELACILDPTPPPLPTFEGPPVPLRVLEARYIEWVLQRVGGNKARAAEVLGVDPSTLYRREKRPAGS